MTWGVTWETRVNDVLKWEIMADKFNMRELCAHCERAMVMHWNYFHDKPELVEQLSSGALTRIAKGLSTTLTKLGSVYSCSKCYPEKQDFVAWMEQKQPAGK